MIKLCFNCCCCKKTAAENSGNININCAYKPLKNNVTATHYYLHSVNGNKKN